MVPDFVNKFTGKSKPEDDIVEEEDAEDADVE
jgi:hypothetical protein